MQSHVPGLLNIHLCEGDLDLGPRRQDPVVCVCVCVCVCVHIPTKAQQNVGLLWTTQSELGDLLFLRNASHGTC